MTNPTVEPIKIKVQSEAEQRSAKAAHQAEMDKATQGYARDFVLEKIKAELAQAQSNWPTFNSAHEGFAILMEEVDELKAHVWSKQANRDLAQMQKEAIQVATMAARFAIEVCSEHRGRK